MAPISISKLSLLIVLIAVTFSCVHTWKGVPRNVEKHEICDSQKEFPQMIQIPMFTSAWQVVYSCDYHHREPVAIAMSIFYLEWHMNFGDPGSRVWKSLNNVMIDWSPKSKSGNAYNITGDRVDGASFGGMALSPSFIWVKPHPNEIICESALIHELVHISIWAIKKTDGDPDHMGSKYTGWSIDHTALIQNVNDTLCALGI